MQRRQKILLNPGKTASGNRRSRDEHKFHRLLEFILMQSKTFTQQTPRATALDRAANAPAGDNTQFRQHAVRQRVPVGDETAKRELLSLLPHACKIALMLESH